MDSVETEGVKAALQSEQLAYQYITLKNILSQKFEPTEITFSRYLVSIEDSCLSIGENLIHSKNILENLNLTATTKNENWHTQKNQVNGLLAATEEALIQLASLYISINEITTKENNRNQLEQSMQNIKELAERAKNYSNF